MATSSPFLRDLQWAIDSPSLIHPGRQPHLADPIWQRDFPLDETALDHFLSRRSSLRVGYYFESLVHFWLRHVRRVEMIEHGTQIIEDGVTRGEIDFLFRDESGQRIHWEVAVKFYLKTLPVLADGSHLIGPNASDNYARKIKRLFGPQLKLSDRLPQPVDHRQGLVKGRIFYHPDDPDSPAHPESLNPDHLRGKWLHFSEASLLDTPGSRYRILKKPHWLADVSGSVEDRDYPSFSLLLDRHFRTSRHPLLLAELRESGGGWKEHERIFLVPDHWPGVP